jgi:2-methylfumaryl-CoA isomerase
LVEAKVATWNYADLKSALDKVGGCYGAYQTMKDAARDPVLVTNNPIFGSAVNPSGLDYPAAGSLASIPQLDRAPPQSAPRLGEHSDAILERVLGLSSGQIAALHDKGLVFQA